MRHIFLVFAFTCLTVVWGHAQSKEAMKKIESARIALITERLNLTPEQAEKFWPVYREFNEQRRSLRMELRDARNNVDMSKLSEEESKSLMNLAFDIRERELNLEKQYGERLQNVISTQQLLQLKNAEKDFQQMLLKRLQNERQKQMQRQQMMQRREFMRGQGNN